MKLKIGYLYRSRNKKIYQILLKNKLRYESIDINDTTSKCYYFDSYESININDITLGYYYFDSRGRHFHSPSPMDLVEEIGKAEDNPEYFL